MSSKYLCRPATQLSRGDRRYLRYYFVFKQNNWPGFWWKDHRRDRAHALLVQQYFIRASPILKLHIISILQRRGGIKIFSLYLYCYLQLHFQYTAKKGRSCGTLGFPQFSYTLCTVFVRISVHVQTGQNTMTKPLKLIIIFQSMSL